jgi:hypothetical protein
MAIGGLTPAAAEAYSSLAGTQNVDNLNSFVHDFLSEDQRGQLRASLRQYRWRQRVKARGEDFVTIKIPRKEYEYLRHMTEDSVPTYLRFLIDSAWRTFRARQKWLLKCGEIAQLDTLVQKEQDELDAYFAADEAAWQERKRVAAVKRKIKENARKARLKNKQ